MTVSSSTNRVNYNGDDSTTVFAYTFKVFDQSDLTVILRSSNGTETVQTITTNYTVSGVGDAGGGNVTMVTAPATGEQLTILREQPLTQGLDLVPNDPFPANSIEESLDKITFMVQKHEEELGRAIKASRTNTISGAEFTVSASDRANKVFAFDSSGDLAVTQELGTFRGDWAASTAYSVRDLVKDTSTNNIFIVNSAHTSSGSQPLTTNANSAKYDLIVDAASATTSANNAATSATAAATSATAAATSATAAATSESNAATSASNASTSETNAAASATNAATSESNAAGSESAAATSETNAATSATSASTSASAAATSATNAASSESNAAASQSAAATSATAAATSATSAATNATNAATSATNASTAQTAAETAQTAAEAAQAAAELAADNFDDTYLGSKSSDPTVDNDGGALNAGDLYFNTTSNTLKVYSGSAWQDAAVDSSGFVQTTGDTMTGALTINASLSVDGGTIKLDGNYPTGTNNVALGDTALNAVGSGAIANTALGYAAGTAITTGDENTAVGNSALAAVTTASNNTALGSLALQSNTSGTSNVGLGKDALKSNTTASENTAVGYQAGYSNTTGTRNTFIGLQSGYDNTTGTDNSVLGDNAAQNLTSGSYNVAVGRSALNNNTTASNNTAVGYQAAYTQSHTNASGVTAVGYRAGYSNNTGPQLFVGREAGYNTTTGESNTAVGAYRPLYSNTTGAYNVALGRQALYSSTTASYNTAVGYQAGYSNTTGAENVLIGAFAGFAGTTATRNTFIGQNAGYNTTGSYNTFIGRKSDGGGAGQYVTTGTKNTIIGGYNGNQGGLDIRTSSNNIVLSDGDGNPRVWHQGSYLACPTVYSFPVAGRDVYVDSNGTVGYLSSVREAKTNITDFTDASWLLNLLPKTFNYRTKDADNNYTAEAEGELYYGLIADEVEAVNPNLCFYNDVDGQQELAGVSYSKMITPMLKLIQEQQATITALEARITALENA